MFQIYSWLTSHTSVHQSQDGLGDLSGSVCVCVCVCVCVTATQTLIINHCVCVCVCARTDRVDSYCLVLLLGNRRVTLWCNRGYEHISHSPRLYQKEKRGHYGGEEGWVGLREGGSRRTVDPQLSSPPTLSRLPHATVSAGATILFHLKQWWS